MLNTYSIITITSYYISVIADFQQLGTIYKILNTI